MAVELVVCWCFFHIECRLLAVSFSLYVWQHLNQCPGWPCTSMVLMCVCVFSLHLCHAVSVCANRPASPQRLTWNNTSLRVHVYVCVSLHGTLASGLSAHDEQGDCCSLQRHGKDFRRKAIGKEKKGGFRSLSRRNEDVTSCVGLVPVLWTVAQMSVSVSFKRLCCC